MYERNSSPQSIGGVLDDGFRLYRASLPKVALLTALGALAGQLPNLTLSSSPTTLNPVFFVALLVSVVLSMLFFAAALGRMDAVARQVHLSMRDALVLGLRRLLPLLGVSLLYGAIVLVGLLLLVVPGIILGLSLMFSVYLVVLKQEGPLAALGSSHRLVWGNWWRTFVIISVGMLVVIAAYLLLGIMIGGVVAAGTSGADFADLVVLIRSLEIGLTLVVGALVAPLFYALMLATYYDLELRRSGADLEQRLTATAPA